MTLVNPPDSRAPKVVRSSVSNSSLFDHLDSTWSMEPGPTPQSCWLSFDVDFAFRSPIYSHVAEMFFSEVVKRMASAFDARCGVRYGPSSLVRLPPPAAAGSRRG